MKAAKTVQDQLNHSFSISVRTWQPAVGIHVAASDVLEYRKKLGRALDHEMCAEALEIGGGGESGCQFGLVKFEVLGVVPEEPLPVRIFANNVFPGVPAGHDIVTRIIIFGYESAEPSVQLTMTGGMLQHKNRN